MKKMISVVLLFTVLAVSLLACGGGSDSYKLVSTEYDTWSGLVSVEFQDGELTISADTSNMSSIEKDNLEVLLTQDAMVPGIYTYSEENGVYTTKTATTPLSLQPTVFKPYQDGKYLVASTFRHDTISTTSTNGASSFYIEKSGKKKYVFTSDGKYSLDGDDTTSGTYTFQDGILTLSKDGKVWRCYLVTGDGKCYTEYLVRQ